MSGLKTQRRISRRMISRVVCCSVQSFFKGLALACSFRLSWSKQSQAPTNFLVKNDSCEALQEFRDFRNITVNFLKILGISRICGFWREGKSASTASFHHCFHRHRHQAASRHHKLLTSTCCSSAFHAPCRDPPARSIDSKDEWFLLHHGCHGHVIQQQP
jgi:hypothetical protein